MGTSQKIPSVPNSPPLTIAAGDRRLLRADTVAAELDVSKRTLQQWVAAEKFPPADLRMGAKLVFWRRETVDAWLDEKAAGGGTGGRRRGA
jgi:predicted DNA-binding transcriptional regulator AlpA